MGRDIADIDQKYNKKIDILQKYAHMINTMPELAPKPKKKVIMGLATLQLE